MSYNYDRSHDSGNFTPGSQSQGVFGYPRTIDAITVHWWGDPSTNPSFEGVRDYLCRTNGDTSAHVVVSGTGRQAACIVNYSDIAWACGHPKGNASTISIELDPRCRDEDYDVAAEVIADIRSAFGENLPLVPHSSWVKTTCPGNYDLARLDKLARNKASHDEWGQVTDKPQPTTTTTTQKPVTTTTTTVAPVTTTTTTKEIIVPEPTTTTTTTVKPKVELTPEELALLQKLGDYVVSDGITPSIPDKVRIAAYFIAGAGIPTVTVIAQTLALLGFWSVETAIQMTTIWATFFGSVAGLLGVAHFTKQK